MANDFSLRSEWTVALAMRCREDPLAERRWRRSTVPVYGQSGPWLSRRGVARTREFYVGGVARQFQFKVIVDCGSRDEVSRGAASGEWNSRTGSNLEAEVEWPDDVVEFGEADASESRSRDWEP